MRKKIRINAENDERMKKTNFPFNRIFFIALFDEFSE